MRIDPIREDPLIGRAELPGAGQHAATVEPHGKIERLTPLQGERFGSQLRGAIERNRGAVEKSGPMPLGETPGGSCAEGRAERSCRSRATEARPAPEWNRRGCC